MSTTITKQVSTSVDEFSNTDLLDSLAVRELNEAEAQQLLGIAARYEPKAELLLSNFDNLQSLVDACISQQQKGIVDVPYTIQDGSIKVEGNLHLQCNEPVKVQATVGFLLGNGTHIFDGLNMSVAGTEATAFLTTQITGSRWTNTFNDCTIVGGGYCYQSSRGGDPDFMCVTSFTNALLDCNHIAISVFSQDGPYKALHLENVKLKTVVTHNIYVHPAVSLRYKNVQTLGAGKLMQHQYSGSGNGGYDTALYSTLEGVNSGKHTFEMTTPANGMVEMKDCIIAPYVTMGVKPAMVNAFKCHFMNNGNGIALRGYLTDCTGGVWTSAGNNVHAAHCTFMEVSFRGGGTIECVDCTIANVWGADRGVNFALEFKLCTITLMQESGHGNGSITLYDTPMPRLSPGFRTGLIAQQTTLPG